MSIHSGGGAWSRGVCSWGGCLVETPPDGYCCGRYASYWNAFLFWINLLEIRLVLKKEDFTSTRLPAQNSVLGVYSTCLSGRGTNMSRSTLPGLSSASSIMSGRFVATTSKTSLLSTDFVSVFNWELKYHDMTCSIYFTIHQHVLWVLLCGYYTSKSRLFLFFCNAFTLIPEH